MNVVYNSAGEIFHNVPVRNMYITIGKTDASASSMHKEGLSNPILWDNPEGWGGKEGGRGVQDGGTHVHLWLMHADVCTAKTTTIL